MGEGGGGFGFDLTLGDRGEEASEGGAEIAGGHIAAGKVIGDILAGGLASKGLWKAWLHGEKQVPSDKVGICDRCTREDTGYWRPSAKVNEHNEERPWSDWWTWKSPERKIRFGIFGGASRRRDALLNENSLAKRRLQGQSNFSCGTTAASLMSKGLDAPEEVS